MHEPIYAAVYIAVIALVTALTRFAPFLLLRSKNVPPIILSLGKLLPYAIMGMLVVYCLKGTTFSSVSGWLPALIASVLVVLSYLWKRSTPLSILLGTVCYMLLVQCVFV